MGKHNSHGAPGKQERKNREEERSGAISASEQIERLDARLGEGVGAKKERAKLEKML